MLVRPKIVIMTIKEIRVDDHNERLEVTNQRCQ